MKPLETYYKLDHTCCLNSSTMKYGIITEDETDRDCKDIEELTDCLDDLENVVKALEIINSKGCSYLEKALIISCPCYEEYCIEMKSNRVYLSSYTRMKALKTQEEYELLKKVLK